MSAASRICGAPESDIWRQVIDLGARLLNVTQFQTDPTAWIFAKHQIIVETAAQIVGGHATLWLAESITRLQSRGPHLGGSTGDFGILISSSFTPLVQQALASGEICLQADGEIIQLPTTTERSVYASLRSPQAISIPLHEGCSKTLPPSVLGVLQLEQTANTTFSPEMIELAAALANQAAMALQASLAIAREKWGQDHLDLVHEVSARIADIRDFDHLARSTTALIQENFGYYYVAIFTLEPEGRSLHFRASAGPLPPGGFQTIQGALPTPEVDIGQGIVGHVAQSGVEILANDVTREAHYRHWDVLSETRSEAALPLKMGTRVLGVLDIQSEHHGFFSSLDMLVLRSLASNLAVALENTRVYGALQTRIEQLSSIYEVTNVLTSLLDEDTLLNRVVELIHSRFGYPYVHIFSVQPGLGRIIFKAGSGSRSQVVGQEGLAYNLDDPQGLIPWVARHADTRLVNDVSTEPLYRPSPLPPEDTRSEMTIPLIFGGEVLGVLDVQSNHLHAFSEEDRFVFESLADNIAIAMRNAQLFRTETWRRQVADSMHQVVGMLSGDASLQVVLNTILVELQRTLPLEVAAIWLADRSVTHEADPSAIHLRLSAMQGEIPSNLDLDLGCTPEEMFDLNLQLVDRQSPPLESSTRPSEYLLNAIQSGGPVIRPPGAPLDPLAALLEFPSDHSAIAAPLKIGDATFGVLTLLHSSVRRYGHEACTIVETFGNYAAVAIENTRLYEAAHEQAWLSTVLLRVAEATQELTDLNELLQTVIQITPGLTGVKACLLFIKDDEENFIPAAASGLESQQQVEFERSLFAAGDVPALDALLEFKETFVLDWDETNQPLWQILDNPGEGSTPEKRHFSVLVPMASHEDLLGAFVVDYIPDSASERYRQSLDSDLDERLAIVQGIAHQTAIAVENIRLVSAQKEAAYVSVALLQVAQAVVSSADLVEALGAIVRITPILAGVDRAVVFLWDHTRQSFSSVQSYGTTQDSAHFEYKRGEFPVLDAVLETDSLMVYPLIRDRDIFKDAPDDWSFLIPPDLDEIEILLGEADRLLLALPLSVKGDILGVLLVEEPVPAHSYSFHGRSNRRLRSKRLEILTGVSQQTALAVQNDILQHEMVERERMEREFQLARQIQRTFLPEIIPEFSGWSLRACWRTAREVGGDFYDFFELPNHRLGLVIADVADKGMPAALFMTVVRSLVRASLDVESSPSAVLERVNRLVVPDAVHGMFITLAYAVLDLKAGTLEYANAGHNPPLVVRKDGCTIEFFERGGMALGVLEDNRIQGGSTHMEPGDYMVMYTDGVTEAFSPDGDIFGEERLYSTITAEIACHSPGTDLDRDAQHLVDAIDQRVSEFIGQASRTDDLTLLVLKRL